MGSPCRVRVAAVSTPQPFQVFQEAIDTERAAWAALKDAMPGTPNFDQAKWDAWQAALRRSDEARKAMLDQMDKRG